MKTRLKNLLALPEFSAVSSVPFSLKDKKPFLLARPAFVLLAFVLSMMFFGVGAVGVPNEAHAFGPTECAASRKGSNLGCTAADVSITGIAISAGGPTSCVGGTTVPLNLDVTVNFAVPDRWDIGIFLVNDGLSPKLLPGGGGAVSCSVGILPTTAPFLNLDPGPWGGILDACGDGNGSISGGTGSGVVTMTGVPVSCKAITSSGGKLYIPFVVTWDNQSSPVGGLCTSILDPVPNTTSKCNSPDTTVAADVAYGTVDLVILPDITKTDGLATITAGDTINYSVVITNTTGDTLSGAVFKDPAVTNLTVNSLVCAAGGGATCPASPTIADMQGAGITIPAMPVNGSVTFTINATLSAAAPAGTLTNTATVTVNGQTNSVSDIDTVRTKFVVTKSFAPASISAGSASVLSVTLQNTNLAAATGVAFTDNYPVNMVNTATPGVTNTCGGVATAVAGGSMLQLSGGTIPSGGSCTVTVNVTSAVSGSYTNNTGGITSTEGYVGDTVSAILSVGASSLANSTKTVEDQNGGDQNPGDVMRYTITLTESAGFDAVGVSLTDTIPATLTGMTVVTCPGGATCNVVGQTLTVTNITVPASSSVTVLFDATIVMGTPPGTTIDNCATITNPGGTGAAPCAPTIMVSASAVPGTGNKPLYLYDATSAPAYKTSRTKPAGLVGTATLVRSGGTRTWTQNPALASSVTISPAVSPTIPVNLYLASNTASESRTVQVSLVCSGGGTTFTQTKIFDGLVINNPYLPTAPPALVTFNLPLVAAQACAAGQTWNLTVTNNTAGGGTRNVIVYPMSGVNNSSVSLPSLNVINVDSVNSYDAAYPAVTTPASGYYAGGQTVYARAVVSDPFGSFDITSAAVTITNPLGTPVVVGAAMMQVADSGAATKTYEYFYVIPTTGPAGFWTTSVMAKEGTEDNVSDSGAGAFTLGLPSFTVVKSTFVYSDPVNGTTNPKAIPGAYMLYTVQTINSGYGSAQAVVMTDPVPANTELFVGDIGGVGSGPVLFVDGGVASGLTYTFISLASGADSPSFSNNGGATYTYTPVPVPVVNGFDANVTNVKVSMGASFNAAIGFSYPSFSLRFRVRVK